MRLARLAESREPRVNDLRDGTEGRKKIYICHEHLSRMNGSRTTEWIGTIDQIRKAFSYTLEVGHSWNPKVNDHPTTPKALEKNINLSFDEKYGSTYTTAWVEVEPYKG